MQLGTRRVDIEPGWQFGSQYPGDPGMVAVYDFLPDALLSQVANLEDFRAILVFDKWVGNADGRQGVFYRAMVRRTDSRGGHPSFVARMIDHGYAFNGPNWDFPESAVQGLYARKLVYDGVRSLDDFEALAGPGGALPRGGHRPGLEKHPAGLDRWRGRRVGPSAGAAFRTPRPRARPDRVLPRGADQPVPEWAVA